MLLFEGWGRFQFD